MRVAACLLVLSACGAGAADPPAMKSYVEFDFAPVPRDGVGAYKLQFTLLTADKDIKLSEPAEFPRKDDPEGVAAVMAVFLNENRWKAEVVDKTKLRVYGRIFNDKLIPVTKGMVESPDLKKEELPTVTLVGKKG